MTLSALGIFSAAGAGGALVSDYELIETQILGSGQSAITFSSLGTYSSTYKHLQIRSASLVNAGTSNLAILRFNGDTGNSYVSHYLEGNGSSVGSNWSTLTSSIYYGFWGTGSTTAVHGAVVDIIDPYSTSKNKTIRSLNGNTNAGSPLATLYSGVWISTASTTSLTISSPSNFLTGSRFSLYGLK
ncbi:hypothetical protein UFOVP692_3 [uncultured Caudovirales phage]|uniref:Uncharacterized protein n=1 Tax=uncultured Caudovirales phage TaxID=2100421 RepID=A0A6J5NDI0_9CAUD|nr:hypothetical protein UFOVP692_3 [uncultured Caudovirales phage]